MSFHDCPGCQSSDVERLATGRIMYRCHDCQEIFSFDGFDESKKRVMTKEELKEYQWLVIPN